MTNDLLAHQNKQSTQNNTSSRKKDPGYVVLPKDIYDLELSPHAKFVLIYLYGFITAEAIRPTTEMIMKKTGYKRDIVFQATKELVEKGLLLKNKAPDKPNHYFILWKSKCNFLPKKRKNKLKLLSKNAENHLEPSRAERLDLVAQSDLHLVAQSDSINNSEINNSYKCVVNPPHTHSKKPLNKSTRIRLIELVKKRTVDTMPHPSGLGGLKKQCEFLDNELASEIDITYEEFKKVESYLKNYYGEPFEGKRINTNESFEGFIKWILKEIAEKEL